MEEINENTVTVVEDPETVVVEAGTEEGPVEPEVTPETPVEEMPE